MKLPSPKSSPKPLPEADLEESKEAKVTSEPIAGTAPEEPVAIPEPPAVAIPMEADTAPIGAGATPAKVEAVPESPMSIKSVVDVASEVIPPSDT